jgi:predicted nucleic acid-binding protein
MSKVYFDTGALVKLYIVESGSLFVQQKAMGATAIPLNQLQETELRNAIHAAIGRKTIPAAAGALALKHLETDIRTGVLATAAIDWPAVWTRAAHLARLHTTKILGRTLDILHVAAAEFCGAELLVTGDERQLRLCKAVGMPVARVPVSD